ncbi:YceI family protein [Hydrogenophaga sp.]|uniref:YceI family protein n=1 Tax=Hydrogenophaga sp. TaxID=1904254 RepID=UPI00272600AA|nr:YceI family protein [Hydrogenophaga sp.]MDO8904507.1 YceI family protein [Hydrogenophaga sp.]
MKKPLAILSGITRRKACSFAAATLTSLTMSLSVLTAPPAQAQPARYDIDPDHLTVAFLVDHIGYAKVLGLFRSARGSYRFDEASATLSDVRIEVETASVFSNQRKRDEHLKGPDFLNSGEFPRMVFTASNAKRSGERNFEITGQLEVLGKTQPLTLQATWNKSAESPIGGIGRKPYVMGVSARGSFKRSAYGMNYAVSNGWVGDEVELIIEFEAVRQ